VVYLDSERQAVGSYNERRAKHILWQKVEDPSSSGIVYGKIFETKEYPNTPPIPTTAPIKSYLLSS